MLKASVETSRSSASLKACGFGSEKQMTPMTSRPDVIGTPSQDSVVAAPSGKIAPAASVSAKVSRRSGRPR